MNSNAYPKETLAYLPISELYPHPDNPRKDVGDVSELAASIRVNGVLQNLTVVRGHIQSRAEWAEDCKAEGVPAYVAQQNYNREDAKCSTGYMVIIGHRRLAAAKEAGLTELPCIISDMSEQEQFETMMIENMQRSDLTPLEEADGMQMMIDTWGATVSSIADSTGLSESTVRRRLSIGKLDRKRVEKGFERGATLQDYMSLDKIKDDEKKNKVLEHIGTADFNQKLKEAEKEQKFRENMDAAIKELREAPWAEEIQMDYYTARKKYEFSSSFSGYSSDETLEKHRKLGAAGKKIYWQISDFRNGKPSYLDLFLEKKQETKKTDPMEDLRAKVKDEMDTIRQELEFKAQEFRDLREDFINCFNKYQTFSEEIGAMAVKTMLIALDRKEGSKLNPSCYDPEIDVEALADALDIDYDREKKDLNQDQLGRALFQKPERVLLRLCYDLMESLTDGENYKGMWEVDARAYRPVYHRNLVLEQLYRMLAELGYEISKEEESYLQGACLQFNEAQATMDKFLEDAKAVKGK